MSRSAPPAVPDSEDPIRMAWRRSALSGLTPRSARPGTADAAAIRSHRLIEAAGPVMDGLDSMLRDTGATVLLADRDGRVVRSVRDGARLSRMLLRRGVDEGATLTEEAVGNNGIGTALETRSGVFIRGEQHFAEVLRDFVCYGHPVIDPLTRRLVGAVNLSGMSADAAHLFAPFVRKIVADIEARYVDTARADDRELWHRFVERTHSSDAATCAFGDEVVLASHTSLERLDSQDLMTLRRLVRRGEMGGAVELSVGTVGVIATAVDVAWAADVFRYYAGWATKIEGTTVDVSMPFAGDEQFHAYTTRVPVGVCGQIIPWNFPLVMAAWKLGPALATGNTLVLKPAEQTPLSALILGEICGEAGVPDGVVNIVAGFGDAGAAISGHPDVDKVAFTGSTEVGKKIVEAAQGNLKKVSLELGGKSANIVFADCDWDAAEAGSVAAWMFNHGQACTAGTRLYVEDSIYEEFTQAVADAAAGATIGHGLDPDTELGPLVDRDQFDKAVLVGCGVPSGWGTATYAGDVRQGDTVVIYGIGSLGINAVQGAVHSGARHVVVVDPVQFKRDEALKFGATHAFADAAEAHAAVEKRTWGQMADQALILVGTVEEQVVSSAFDVIGKGGKVVITGLGNMTDKTVQVSGTMMALFGKTITGTLFGSANPQYDIVKLLRLYDEGKLKLDELITTTYSLDQVNQGYQDLQDGKIMRGVIIHDS